MEKIENIETLIYEETKKRLKIMESKDYVFPKKITKTDVYIIISVLIINISLIVLCMLGVIV